MLLFPASNGKHGLFAADEATQFVVSRIYVFLFSLSSSPTAVVLFLTL